MSIKRELRESFIAYYKGDIEFIRAEQCFLKNKELTAKQIKLNEIEQENNKLYKNNIFVEGNAIQFKFYPYFESIENIQTFKFKKNLTDEISSVENKTLLKNGLDGKVSQVRVLERENPFNNQTIMFNMNFNKNHENIKSSNNLLEFSKRFKKSNIKNDVYTMTYNSSIVLAINHLESICYPKKSLCK